MKTEQQLQGDLDRMQGDMEEIFEFVVRVKQLGEGHRLLEEFVVGQLAHASKRKNHVLSDLDDATVSSSSMASLITSNRRSPIKKFMRCKTI